MAGPFALDGYDVLAPLGAAGRSWRAVCLADGDRVVLRRWVGGARGLAEIRRRAALWGSVPGGGVVAVRAVVALGDDVVVVTDHATGGGLDSLVARRGGLTTGQVVTVVAPIARTLAAAHERGMVHGRVSMSTIVIDQDGRPMLTDWLPAGTSDPAADVAALAAMAAQCADDTSEALLSALRSAGDARSLAEVLLCTVQAEPLLVPTTAVAVETPEHDQPVRPRRGVAAVVVSGVIAVAVGGGVLWGRDDPAAGGTALPPPVTSVAATPSPALTSTASPPDWTSTVRALERRRLRALTVGDRRLLAASEVPDTRLWRHDIRLLAQLRGRHALLGGTQVRVRSVRVKSVQRRLVVLQVTDAFSSYDAVEMRLRHVEGKWLIVGVSRRSR